MDPTPTSPPEILLDSEVGEAEPGSPPRPWISLSSAVRTASTERLDCLKLPEHAPQMKPEIFIEGFCPQGGHASVDTSAMLTASAVVPTFSPMASNQVRQNPVHLNFMSPVCPPPYNPLTFGVKPGLTSFLCGPCAPPDPYRPNVSETRNQPFRLNVSPLSYPAPLGLNLNSPVLVPVSNPVQHWCSAQWPLYCYHLQPEVRPSWCLCPHTVSAHQTFNPALFSTPRNTKRRDRNVRRPSNEKQGPLTAVEEKLLTHEVLRDDAGSKIQGSKDEDETEVSEERKEAGMGNGSFVEYLEELCSNEDFVRKVESILDMGYLNSLLSPDAESVHLSVLEQQQQEMIPKAGQYLAPDPRSINSEPNPDRAGPDSSQKMGSKDGWGNASPLLTSHLPEETTDAPTEGRGTPLLSSTETKSPANICSFLRDNGDHLLSSLTQTGSFSHVLPQKLTSEPPEFCSPSAGQGRAQQQKTTTAGEETSSEQSPETQFDTVLRCSLRLLCQNGREKAEKERGVLAKEKKQTKKSVRKPPEGTPKRDMTSYGKRTQSSERRQLFRKVQSGCRSKRPETNANPADHSGEEDKSSLEKLNLCELTEVPKGHLSEPAWERAEEDGSQTASAAKRKTKNTVSEERKQPAGHRCRQEKKRSKAPPQTDPEVDLQDPAREPQPGPLLSPPRRNRRMKDKKKKSNKLTAVSEDVNAPKDQVPQKCSPAETRTRSKKSTAARKGDQKGSGEAPLKRTKPPSAKKSKKSLRSSSILCPESSPATQDRHCAIVETKTSKGLQAAGNGHKGGPKQIRGDPGLKSPLKRCRLGSSKEKRGGGNQTGPSVEKVVSWEGKLSSSPAKKRKEDKRKRLRKSKQDLWLFK